MFFNSSSTYALRALAFLAAAGEAPCLGREVAERVRVPPPYLAKIMSALARAGLVRATRGSAGGYRLARPAAEIHLVDVVAPFEGPRLLVGCLLDPEKTCSDAQACCVHGASKRARSAYLAFLEHTTLAEVPARAAPAARRRAPARRRPSRS